MHSLWFKHLSAILDPCVMDEAMKKGRLNCGLNVCDNNSMGMFEGCPNNELLELLKTEKHARMFFVQMLKYFENKNHILRNSLCESNSLIKKYKRRNRILCEKVDNLKKKIHSNNSMENGEKSLFEGQECLSHACLFVHTSLKVFNSCLWYLDSGCSHHMTGDKSLFKSLKEKVGDFVTFGDGSHAQVLDKGTVEIPRLPLLKDVLYIKRLKANLLSITQICDEDFLVQFSKKGCIIINEEGIQVLEGNRTTDNCYGVVPMAPIACRSARVNMLELWHHRFGHANFKQVAKVSKLEAVEGLPKFGKVEKTICGACQMGKKTRASHHKVNVIATSRCLELLHVDLMGPTRTESLGGKRYIMVIVDDFSRYTWVEFLREKSEACEKLEILCKRLQNEKGIPIVKMRSDHGKEFENARFESFCEKNGIKREFSTPKTPRQNGVVERKNRVIQEMARVMLLNKKISQKFWGEAVNTSCHIGNRIFFRVGTKKTAYEIWKGKKPKVKYFRVFGSKCYILNDRENLGKFDAKSDEGIFLGYSTTSRAYRVFNKRNKMVMESINVKN